MNYLNYFEKKCRHILYEELKSDKQAFLKKFQILSIDLKEFKDLLKKKKLIN